MLHFTGHLQSTQLKTEMQKINKCENESALLIHKIQNFIG